MSEEELATQETLEDQELMDGLEEARAEIDNGDVVSLEQVETELRQEGRL